jgi:hypothetical protein
MDEDEWERTYFIMNGRGSIMNEIGRIINQKGRKMNGR